MKNRGVIFWVSYGIAAAALIWAGSIFRLLPDTIPVHWNALGHPDRYAEKISLVWFGLTVIGVPVFMDIIPRFDPRYKNYDYFSSSYQMMKLGITAFLVLMFILTTLATLTPDQRISPHMITVGMGILFMIIGNYLSKVRSNFFVGIRTPWTLSSDLVWRKTHRLGGWLIFITGLFSAVAGFFIEGETLFWIVIAAIIGAPLIAMAYSYFLYRKLNGRQEEG